MTGHPDRATFRAVPCLSEFTDGEAAAGAAKLRPHTLAPGEVLFRQGDAGDAIYVLVTGEIGVRFDGPEGGHDLATLGPGTLLGELAFLSDGHRSASAVARTEAELWELTRVAFEAGLDAGEAWATRFLMAVARELARRMLAVDGQLVALMEEDKRQRVPAERVRELEVLRRRLSGEWSF